MAEGYGPSAREWALRLPPELPLIAADFTRSAAALARAATLKAAGRNIAGTVLLPDIRSLLAATNGCQLLAQTLASDERDFLFSALSNESLEKDGVNQRDWIKFDPAELHAVHEFLAACDMLVSRSATETQRIISAIGYLPVTTILAAPRDPTVPHRAHDNSGKHDGIVVWAVNSNRDECALFAFALESLRIPVRIVCRAAGPPLTGLRAQFYSPVEGARLLSQAAAIIDGSIDDPGTAIGLCEFGVPLATACTSGAHEWLRPVHMYAPWNARSIFNAAVTALGGRSAHAVRAGNGVADIEAELRIADNALPTTGPLVSIIIPTYNRRERLRAALKSVAKQQYRSIEIVVVNDGGEDVSDVVAEYALARLVVNERNLGVTPSVNAGVLASHGEYLCFLADDDYLAPDHASRLVASLERSGLNVAHSKELACHYNVLQDGVQQLTGHHIGAPEPTYPSDMLVINRIGGPGMMVRRRALSAAGLFDSTMRHGSDFEMWMRLSNKHDFGFVNHVTAHVSMRNDRSQISSVSGAETASIMSEIYAKHPVAGRALLEEKRSIHMTACGQQDVVRSAPMRRLEAADVSELESHQAGAATRE